MARSAPAWRSFVPTYRQLRFSFYQMLQKRAPQLARRLNLYMVGGNPKALASEIIAEWSETSDTLVSPEEEKFLAQIAKQEMKTCGCIHTFAHRDYQVYKYENVGVFGRTGQIVLLDKGVSLSPVFRNSTRIAPLLRRRHISGAVISAVGINSRNYYHFMLERSLDRLQLIERIADREPERITVLRRPNRSAYELAFYDELAKRYPQINYEEVRPHDLVSCDTLYNIFFQVNCTFRSPTNPEALSKIRNFFLNHYGVDHDLRGKRLIYASRADSPIRRLIDEKELLDELTARGFEVVIPGKLSHEEQIRTFKEARMVIGTHGAGLTNLMFCNPGTHMFEMFGPNYCQTAYRTVCKLGDLPWAPIIGISEHAHQSFLLGPELRADFLERVDQILASDNT